MDLAFGLRWFKPPKFWGTRGRQEKGGKKKWIIETARAVASGEFQAFAVESNAHTHNDS